MRMVKTLMIAVAAAVAVGALAIGLLSHRRSTAVREYEAQGFQMVQGCNGGAAVRADGQVMMIKQYLEDLTYPPVKDTNMVAQLQSALVAAQEKARVLSEDCRRRGHRETHPWKTNWVTIKQALTAFEKSNQ
jgi:hypothetical protein